MAEISPALYRAGDGEPLVLIHGFTATWRCWLPVLAELVPRFEVIAPTLHGHDGGPELGSRQTPHDYAAAADKLEEQLDALGVGTAHLAGNSLGGGLALELAKRGRARSVVGISPAGGIRTDDGTEADRIIKLFARSQKITARTVAHLPKIMRSPLARRIALRDVMARGDQVPAREAALLAQSSIRCTVVDDVFQTLRERQASLSGLEQIDVPVLVTFGERDRILPAARHAPRLRAEIPGVEYRILAGMGHTPMWDDASLIAATIGDFAAGVVARGQHDAARVVNA